LLASNVSVASGSCSDKEEIGRGAFGNGLRFTATFSYTGIASKRSGASEEDEEEEDKQEARNAKKDGVRDVFDALTLLPPDPERKVGEEKSNTLSKISSSPCFFFFRCSKTRRVTTKRSAPRANIPPTPPSA